MTEVYVSMHVNCTGNFIGEHNVHWTSSLMIMIVIMDILTTVGGT